MGRKRQMKFLLVLCISPLILVLYMHIGKIPVEIHLSLSHNSIRNRSAKISSDDGKSRKKVTKYAHGMNSVELSMNTMRQTSSLEAHIHELRHIGENGVLLRTSVPPDKGVGVDIQEQSTTTTRVVDSEHMKSPFGYTGEDVVIQSRLANGSTIHLDREAAADTYYRQRTKLLHPGHPNVGILREELRKDYYRNRTRVKNVRNTHNHHHMLTAKEMKARKFAENAGAEEWMAYTAHRNNLVSTKAILWDEEWMHEFAKKSTIDLMDITIVGKGILPMRANDFRVTSSMVGKTLQDLREKIRDELLRMHLMQPTKAVEYDRDNLPVQLYKLAPYLLDKIPHEFLPSIKNPCWLNKGDQFLSCLPYFYLIGAPKSATTDLWTRISHHPYVINSYNKEPQFWTRGNLVKGLMKYCANFLMLSQAISSHERGQGMISGDGTASNFWERRRAQILYGQQPDGPPYFTADLLRAIQPNAKLIVIVREPSSRLYSEYLDLDSFWPLFKSPEDFHVRVEDIIRHFNGCIEAGNHVAGCASNYYQPRMQIGMYSVHLREWLKRFPSEQIFVLRTEDWAKNPQENLKKIFQFLDLKIQNNLISKLTTISRQNQRKKQNRKIGAMLPETRHLLDAFYQPFNEDLAKLMNDDKYLWND